MTKVTGHEADLVKGQVKGQVKGRVKNHAKAREAVPLTTPVPEPAPRPDAGPGRPPPGPAARLRGRLRQRRFPEEFRIPPGHLYRVPAPASTPAGRPGAEDPGLPDPTLPDPTLPDPALADLATHLWRLAKKLGPDHADGTAHAGQRLAGRHLRAAREALTQAGVETQDHDGSDFDIGLSLHVLAYQPTPGATRETVLETIRPSVYRDGRQIQIGQVIVAQPEGVRPIGEQEHDPRDR